MQKISKTQGEELLRLVDELKIHEVFELLDNYGFKEDVTINILRREYIRNHYGADFYERLKACIGNITDNSLIETEYDIFFSFSSKNRAEAEPIVKLLRECELAVFFSDEELQKHAGTLFIDKISEALHSSKHFLLYCTPEAMRAEWVKFEYKTFITNAYIPSGGKRHLFILQGSNFSSGLVAQEKLFKGIQQSENITDILKILGKTLPLNDLAERKAEYKELLELFLENSQNINDKQRKQLVSKQKELKLTEEQVAEIEREVANEFDKKTVVKLPIVIDTTPIIEPILIKNPIDGTPKTNETIEGGNNNIQKYAPITIESQQTNKVTKKRIIFSFLLQFFGLGLHYGGSKHWSKWLYISLFAINLIPVFFSLIFGEKYITNSIRVIPVYIFIYPVVVLIPFLDDLNFTMFYYGIPFIYHFIGLTYWLVGFIDIIYFLFKKDLRLVRTIYLSILILVNLLWLSKMLSYDDYDIFIKNYSKGLAVVHREGKYGFINQMGIEVINCEYDDVGSFYEGLAYVRRDFYHYTPQSVEKSSLYGFIDKTGKEVIKLQYDDVGSFSKNLACVKKGNLYGFIDKTGKEVIKPQYNDAGYFYEGLAAVRKGKDALWGFIDKTGKEVIKLQYDDVVGRFSENLACVKKGNLWGFIDKTGKEVIKLQYDNARSFENGKAEVRKNGKWFYINKQGECVKDCP